jgi:ribosomal peptide maturation radical SAM protein 1
MKIAMFSVPFHPPKQMNLALSIFKQQFNDNGIKSKVFYPSQEFCNRLTTNVYEKACGECEFISSRSAWEPTLSWHEKVDRSDHQLAEEYIKTNRQRVWLAVQRLRIEFEDFVEEFSRRDFSEYDILAFSGGPCQVPAIFCFARALKKSHPSAKFFFGGCTLHGSIGIEYITKLPYIDCMTLGEAEHSFLPIVKAMAAGVPMHEAAKDFHSIAYRTPDGRVKINPTKPACANLNEIPVPDFSDFFEICGKPRHYPTFFSRGCSWALKNPCSFCVEHELSGGAYIERDPKNTLQYLSDLVKKYPDCSSISTADAMLRPTFIREVLAPWSKMRPPHVSIFFEIKPWIKRDEIRILKQAGITDVQTGIENLDYRSVELLNKGHRTFHSIACLKWCKFYKIRVVWNWIVPIIGEQPEWYAPTIELCRNLSHLQPPQTPTPLAVSQFSDYTKNPQKWGITKLIPSTIFPDEIDATKTSWFFHAILDPKTRFAECEAASQPLRRFLMEWGVQSEIEDIEYLRSLFPPPRRSRRQSPRLQFTETGVFDNRFIDEGDEIELTEEAKELLLFCDPPRPQRSVLDRYPQQVVDDLVARRLLYWDEEHAISYVESLPDEQD